MIHGCTKAFVLCDHERVEYCKHCQKVFCLACGREWPKKEIQYIERYSSYPIYAWHPDQPYYTWQYGNTSGSSANADISNTDGEQYKMDVPTVSGTAVYCDHGR